MRRITLGLVGALLCGNVAAQCAELAVGEHLPSIRGQFLTGRDAQLPEAASGRAALLMLGFTYDARFDVEAWAGRFRHDFGSPAGVTFFEVPMIGGAAVMGKWFIDSGMRRGTPKADQEHVITVYGGVDAWKKRVGFQDPKAAYLVLIDSTGKVLWRQNGPFEERRYQALSLELTRLIAAK